MNKKEIIILQDNKSYKLVSDQKAITVSDQENNIVGKIPENEKKNLEDLCSINELIKNHKALTIPHREEFKDDRIIETKNNELCTNNWVGVVNVAPGNSEASLRIEITSRFDNKEKQYFLLYMLCTVYGFNIFNIDIDGNDEGNYLIILVIIYINSLIEALSEGVYKEYIT